MITQKWINFSDAQPKYEGYYFVGIPINPIEGFAIYIYYYNPQRGWIDKYNKPVKKEMVEEFIVWSEIIYPQYNDVAFWKNYIS